MASNASLHDDEDQEGSRKRKKRYVRSKLGCSTCRLRKVKCDERRPVCLRCETEERQCNYHQRQMPSPGRAGSHKQQSNWLHSTERSSAASTSRMHPPAAPFATVNASLDHHFPIQEGRVGAPEPTQYDDWLAYLFGSSAQSTPHLDLESSISEWMSNNTIFLLDSTPTQPSPTSTIQRQHVLPFHTTNDGEDALSSEKRQKLADSTLQRRLRELCTSGVQLEAVSQCE